MTPTRFIPASAAARLAVLLGPGLGLTACQIGDGFDEYYEGATGPAPTISSVETDSTLTGNTGGQTLVIKGSGFGSDPAGVTVQVGDLAASITSVSDGELVVVAPQGPVHGGPVDVSVGTLNGQVTLDDGFEYELSEVYDDQSAYIVINNDWFSCYGGVGTEFGCETFAWVGYTGIDGRGEFLEETIFPRQHGQFVGYWGGGDVTNEWRVDSPAYNYIPLDIESAVEDLRDKRITGFTLTNENLEDEDPWCADLSALALYSYGGGDPVLDENGDVVGVSGADGVGYTANADLPLLESADMEGDACADSDDRVYDLSTLRFCETYYDNDANLSTYERAGTWIYDAEWPIGEYSFFVGESGNPSRDQNVEITLDIPEIDLEGVDLVLPPYSFFEATAGFTGFNNDPALWSIGEYDACPDGDGDGRSTLDEAAWRFQWVPADLPGADDRDARIKDVESQVRLSINSFFLGWYGGEGFNMRASITVPDDNAFDEETGYASVEVPADILLQFPNLTASVGATTDPFGNTVFNWGDPVTGNYGYLLVTMERATEYRIEADALPGDLVFSYVTGDFAFFDWNNPLHSGSSCEDCQDNDGDGWADALDPDCEDGAAEDNSTYGGTTCNDGVDNDDDGLVDAEDPDCEDGLDGETNCSDGIDNDGDGYADGLDGECGPLGSGVELGEDDPDWDCSNGLDDDSDGWVDFDDPDCAAGSDPELGYGATQCNDGLDNDGHGDVDAMDLLCVFRGAENDAEEPSMTSACADGTDNDGDGYVDRNDPDCELPPYSVETYTAAQESWGWTSQCYNGVDDDSDGDVDALDLGCAAGGEADGFTDDEGAAR